MNVIDRAAARALRPARGVSLAALVALGLLAGPAVAQSALQTIDPAALQATFDGLADELLQPGAVMLLRTPQGEVVLTHGAPLAMQRRSASRTISASARTPRR
jgi:hypothetical protein